MLLPLLELVGTALARLDGRSERRPRVWRELSALGTLTRLPIAGWLCCCGVGGRKQAGDGGFAPGPGNLHGGRSTIGNSVSICGRAYHRIASRIVNITKCLSLCLFVSSSREGCSLSRGPRRLLSPRRLLIARGRVSPLRIIVVVVLAPEGCRQLLSVVLRSLLLLLLWLAMAHV